MPKIDPTLASLLEQARASKDPLQVVVVLKPDSGEQVSSPGRTEEMATELLRRVEKETGEAPLRYNVFRNLSSLAVEATPNFIERLVEKDEVVSAVANQQSSSAVVSKTIGSAVASKTIKQPATSSSKAPALLKRSKSIKKK